MSTQIPEWVRVGYLNITIAVCRTSSGAHGGGTINRENFVIIYQVKQESDTR
jgi:hypothetical protein